MTIEYRPPVTKAVHRGSDSWGQGHFGASRGSRTHNGEDYLVPPWAEVFSASTGKVTKLGICYRGAQYRYVQVTDNQGNHVRHFYVEPLVRIGDKVDKGQLIGLAQDLTTRYPADDTHEEAMPNHVHLEVMKPGEGREFIDPKNYQFT